MEAPSIRPPAPPMQSKELAKRPENLHTRMEVTDAFNRGLEHWGDAIDRQHRSLDPLRQKTPQQIVEEGKLTAEQAAQWGHYYMLRGAIVDLTGGKVQLGSQQKDTVTTSFRLPDGSQQFVREEGLGIEELVDHMRKAADSGLLPKSEVEQLNKDIVILQDSSRAYADVHPNALNENIAEEKARMEEEARRISENVFFRAGSADQDWYAMADKRMRKRVELQLPTTDLEPVTWMNRAKHGLRKHLVDFAPLLPVASVVTGGPAEAVPPVVGEMLPPVPAIEQRQMRTARHDYKGEVGHSLRGHVFEQIAKNESAAIQALQEQIGHPLSHDNPDHMSMITQSLDAAKARIKTSLGLDDAGVEEVMDKIVEEYANGMRQINPDVVDAGSDTLKVPEFEAPLIGDVEEKVVREWYKPSFAMPNVGGPNGPIQQ